MLLVQRKCPTFEGRGLPRKH